VDDVILLRHLLEANGDVTDAASSVKNTVEWRQGTGRGIVKAAADAIAAARVGGSWNNDQVFCRAPHSSLIAPYILPSGSQFRAIVRFHVVLNRSQ
jgi:hypothetical protein